MIYVPFIMPMLARTYTRCDIDTMEDKVLLGAIIGAVTTLFANLVAEKYKQSNESRLRAKNFRVLADTELNLLGKLFEKLKGSLEDRGVYLFRWTKVIRKSTESLNDLRRQAYVLNSINQQTRFSELVTDANLFIDDVEGIENIKAEWDREESTDAKDRKDRDDFLNQRRVEKHAELIDLIRRINETRKTLASKSD